MLRVSFVIPVPTELTNIISWNEQPQLQKWYIVKGGSIMIFVCTYAGSLNEIFKRNMKC